MNLRHALFAVLLTLSPAAVQAVDPVIAAAGDIACDPTDPSFNAGAGTATACRMRATSDLLVGGAWNAVLLLGDNQYWEGTLAAHQASFAPSWGRLGSLLRPVPGNHEYLTPGAAGYYDYFGAAAGDRTKGWYSFDLGAWHIVALNSNCEDIGGCGPRSQQLRWLAKDLAAHPTACTLAYWHHPRFSSGAHGDDATTTDFWRVLYDAGAELVLVGHDHDYERFAPQDPSGKWDPQRGIRQFVVGTGGRETRSFATIRANSEARNSHDLGVLKLRLRPGGYDWQFLPAAGGTYTDQGSTECHIP
ncbi:MAG TPA: metallophosphoesterase [Thermoanaerobaculia bacterium]|nr:metallophosphoesterase [Thermoanaerobaculia bacterium]